MTRYTGMIQLTVGLFSITSINYVVCSVQGCKRPDIWRLTKRALPFSAQKSMLKKFRSHTPVVT